MLDVIKLDFDYQESPLLQNVNFHLPSGGLLHLKGANGAGKTTLLKLIAGLYRPTQGEIQFNGKAIQVYLIEYQRQLSFMGHKTGINPNLTLLENCLFDPHCILNKEQIQSIAALFNLESYMDYPCELLSAGQRRKVGLLRLWFSNSLLWLLDEPLVALDDASIELMMKKIAQHRARGGAVLLTSHQSLPLDRAEYLEYSL